MSDKSAFDAMMDDGQTAAAPSPAPAHDPANGSQPRDDAGRFATKPSEPVAPAPSASAPAASSQPMPAATPTPAAEPKQENVPLATFLDMRDENKTLKQRLKEIEQRQAAEPAPQVPSATADPEGFSAYMADLANRTRMNTVFEVSETMAIEKHGAEAVQKAMDWAMGEAQASPSFAAEYLRQKHPIDWAVKQQKRHGFLATVGDDPEAYIAAEVAKRLAAGASPVAQPSPAAPATPAAQPAQSAPRSLASMPSAGSQHTVPSGPGKAFEAAFP